MKFWAVALSALVAAANLPRQFVVGPVLTGVNVAVTITSPTSASTYDNGTTTTVSLGGTAQSDTAVAGCTYTNSLGGSGSATGTTSWSISSVSLAEGDNVLTVTCRNATGSTGTDIITVTVSAADNPEPGAGIARGCTTAWYIDWDCDGYGPGVRASGVYGWDQTGVGDMPDADDAVESINTTATVAAAYGSGGTLTNAQLKTFLATRGYTAENVFYISTTGNNGTGTADNPSLPFASYQGVHSLIDPGDVVVYRAGTYADPAIGSYGGTGFPVLASGSSGSPIIFMSYPGENVKLTYTGSIALDVFSTSNSSGTTAAAWGIWDGFTVDNVGTKGLASGWNCSGAQNFIIRNIETQGFNYVTCINGMDDLTVERSVFHHMDEHNFYMGSNSLESDNVLVQDNIFYSAGYDWAGNQDLSETYGGHQFNGRCASCVWQRNISHSNSGWGFSFAQGVHGAVVKNNLAFNNGTVGFTSQIYDGDCTITGLPNPGAGQLICPYDSSGVVYENNTVMVGDHRADGNTASVAGHAAFQFARDTQTCVSGGASVAATNCNMDAIFRNNVIVILGNTGAAFRYKIQQSIDTWDADSTFDNNIVYKDTGTNVLTTEPCDSTTSTGEAGCPQTDPPETYTYAQWDSTYSTTGNVNSNPLLVRVLAADYDDAGLFDFRPLITSPAIDAATSTGIPTDDIRQNTRVSLHDIGAYQFALPTVTWTTATPTGAAMNWTGYRSMKWDPVSGQTLMYTTRSTGSGIYGTDFFAYNGATQVLTRLGGTGSNGGCNDGSASDVLPWPYDRHPVDSMAIDTTRSRLWMSDGTCAAVAGYIHQDLWYYALNATPSSNTWTQVISDPHPSAGSTPGYDNVSLVHDPVTDVLVYFGGNLGGFHKTWVYCPGTGSPSGSQTSAGCTTRGTFYETTPGSSPGTDYEQFPQGFWDSYLGKVIGFHRDQTPEPWSVWTYTATTQTWANRSASGMPSESVDYWGTPEYSWAQILSGPWAGGYLYVRVSTHSTSAGTATVYFYNPVTNAMTQLTTSGTGPTHMTNVAFDDANQLIVSHEYTNVVKHGTLQ